MGAIAGLVQRLAASLSRAEKREKFVAGEQGEVGVATALHGFLPDSELRTKTPTLAGHVSHTLISCVIELHCSGEKPSKSHKYLASLNKLDNYTFVCLANSIFQVNIFCQVYLVSCHDDVDQGRNLVLRLVSTQQEDLPKDK